MSILTDASDAQHMSRALVLARRGEGFVEPNPMVGCVLVRDGTTVGEGWHGHFGGPHAEAEALQAAGRASQGATAYVTLEPCAHAGKTPACTRALIAAGVVRVVLGSVDSNPHVKGGGVAELRQAGIQVDLGVLVSETDALIAPFAKLITQRLPWVIAKWAMTLDGKLATATGGSRWISGETSRARAHQLRGRVDAVVVGRGTAAADDPLLTARPAGPRTATRIVLDSQAALSPDSQLVRTAVDAPVLVVAAATAPAKACEQLRRQGVEVWQASGSRFEERMANLLQELGRRQMTNVLVEGGARVFGTLFDLGALDEVHTFIAPRLVGGGGPSPVAGRGVAEMPAALNLHEPIIETVGEDVYVYGRVKR